MSSELYEVADAVSGLTIEGPGTSTLPPPASVPPPPEPEIEPEIDEDGENDEPESDQGTEALFDVKPFLNAPAIDGQAADTIKVSFSGSVEFDAASDEGRRLFDDLSLGREVELRVAGVVSKKNGSWKRKADDSEVVTGVAGIAVETLHMLTPEQL